MKRSTKALRDSPTSFASDSTDQELLHVPMDECQGSSDMLVAKAPQPSTFLVSSVSE